MTKQFIKTNQTPHGLTAIFQKPGIPFPGPPESLTLEQIKAAQASLRSMVREVMDPNAHDDQIAEYQKGIDALTAQQS